MPLQDMLRSCKITDSTHGQSTSRAPRLVAECIGGYILERLFFAVMDIYLGICTVCILIQAGRGDGKVSTRLSNHHELMTA